jgi:hypothetical protein
MNWTIEESGLDFQQREEISLFTVFTRVLGPTYPFQWVLSTRNLPGGKMRPAHKADNLTAICEPIV